MSVFWDSSALIHLFCDQGNTQAAEKFFVVNPKMIVWWGSIAECVSAISRLERESHLNETQATLACKRLTEFRKVWFEVCPVEHLLQKAVRLLRVHALRSADAFQLAAALCANADRVSGLSVLSFDKKLLGAASREGLTVADSF